MTDRPTNLRAPSFVDSVSGLRRRDWLAGGAALAASAAYPLQAHAANSFATKPVRLIVPFAAGGATDVMARAMGEAIGKDLGQPVVVDNKPGAAGIIACDALAKAPPDGHTWMLGTTSTMLTNRFLYKKLPYDPIKDLAWVGRVCTSPIVLAVHQSVPAKTVAEVLAYLQANPGKLSYGSYGLGSHAHLILAYMSRLTNADAAHVAYKGEAPMILDLIAGQVKIAMGSPMGLKPHVDTGKLRLIGIIGKQRSNLLPDLPTFWEQNQRAAPYQTVGVTAFAAHGKTPIDIQNRFAQAAAKALKVPEVRARIEATGYPLVDDDTPAAFTADVNRDMPQWQSMIEQAGVEPT